MKKLLFIINPMAGRQQAQTDLYKMVKIFADHDYEVTVYPTRARLDCTRKVLEDAGRADGQVIGGAERNIAHGAAVLPLHHAADHFIEGAIAAAADDQIEPAGVLQHLPGAILTADDEQFEEDYLFGAVTNTISLGGVLKLDPEKVLLDDGMYELLLVKNPTNALEAQAMLTALMTQNFDGPLVKMFHASDITFESSHEISWTIDGEYGGTFSHTHILNNKNAVTLIV